MIANLKNDPLYKTGFIAWFLALSQSQFGSALTSIALSFLVLEQSESVEALAITIGISFVPFLILPFSGALLDNINIKLPIIISDVLRGTIQISLAIMAITMQAIPIEIIYTLTFLNSLISVFSTPAANSALPVLVDKDLLGRANGIMAQGRQSAWILGYLLGGIIISVTSPAAALAIDGLSYFISAVALYLFVDIRKEFSSQVTLTSYLRDVKEGFVYLKNKRVIILIAIISMLINAATAPMHALVPQIMLDNDWGAKGYSFYVLAQMVGVILAGMYFSRREKNVSMYKAMSAGLIISLCSYYAMSTGFNIIIFYHRIFACRY